MARNIDAQTTQYLEGPRGLKVLPPSQQAAWFGMLQAHAELTRALDTELAARHGLSLSAYEVLSRIGENDEAPLKMTQLADQTQLSLSRVSRIIDELVSRGHVARLACPGDSRAVHLAITDPGCEVLAAAQETFFAVIEERFLGRMSCDEVELLGSLFARLVERGPTD